jgi:predicted acylesterase/phospholipase RssA
MAEAENRGRAVLVLGAGAPHSSLMAGALCAIWEAGKTFDTIYTAGAGGLMGMLFAAPANGDPRRALRDVVEAGVSDEIYQWFPINYKTFFKPGPYTQLFRHWARRFHIPDEHWVPYPGPFYPGPIPPGAYPGHPGYPGYPHASPGWPFGWSPWWPLAFWLRPHGAARRLYNDWIDFVFSALTPTDLNYFSEGLCEPLPFLEEMVSFEALRRFPGDFYLNAYNITKDSVEQFGKDKLTALHFRAALASPFIYPPVAIGDQMYYEGADRSPLPSHHFPEIRDFPNVGIVAIMDILGSLGKSLVRRPRNLWDAYLISIVTPIVSLAKRDLGQFRIILKIEAEKRRGPVKPHHVRVKFRLPPEQASNLLDWRYSNLRRLWQIGYEAGERFIARYHRELPDRPTIPPDPRDPAHRAP